MSTTMVVAMAPPPSSTFTGTAAAAAAASHTPTTAPTGTNTESAIGITYCPSCGDGLPSTEQTQADLLRAHARIADLEAQVRILNQKAAAAVDRWADYEDELSKYRSQKDKDAAPPPLPPKPDPTMQPLARSQSLLQSGTNRISQFLTRSRTIPANMHHQHPGASRHGLGGHGGHFPPSPANTTEDLLEALSREQSLRREAEGKLNATSMEVEELSVTLFEQANEMVAEERRARAKLEARVGELEKRDTDKKRRLERLETAMARIETVRALLEE
jgi:hypothetical protein